MRAGVAPYELAPAAELAGRRPTAADDGVGAVAGEPAEEPAGAEDDPLGGEGDGEEEALGRFGVLTNGVVGDGVVTDGVLDGVATEGVLTTGVDTLGVVADGVVADGVLTVGVGPTGVVTCGVVTEGTAIDGTVIWGVVSAGRFAAGVLTVGSPTLGSVAAVPASGGAMRRARATAATAANDQILRMPLKRSPAAKLAFLGEEQLKKHGLHSASGSIRA